MNQPFAQEVAAARAAQAPWSQIPIRERLRPIRTLRRLIVARTDALLEAVAADIGRPAVEVLASELLPAAAALQFLERRAEQVLAPRRIGWRQCPLWLLGCRDAVHRRPWGVVGAIGTWNYPIFLNVGPLAQALVAGNAVLWKPSENALRTADLLQALFLEAGFPANLLHKLPATREAGPQLAEAAIDYVVFTGSDAVGRRLAGKLGERLIPSTLELSGCDVLFVLADADVDLAAKAAWFGVTLNRGQTCIAVRRIFVEQSKAAAFEESLRKLKPNLRPMTLVTPGQAQQAHRLIEDAVARGARPLQFAAPTAAEPIPPTFLLDSTTDAGIFREACFAPVAAVIPFDRLDRAVAQSNACAFGLGASIFTADTRAAEQLAARLPAGSVSINDVLAPTAHPATPFGGRGLSGWGVTQGAEGLLGMTATQVVSVRGGRFRPHLDDAVAPDPATVEILRGLLRWTHARGLREKLRGLMQLIRGGRSRR
jgi:acyl-CoA reductase-like NAD-dependent aldehyde dehydrogenase